MYTPQCANRPYKGYISDQLSTPECPERKRTPLDCYEFKSKMLLFPNWRLLAGRPLPVLVPSMAAARAGCAHIVWPHLVNCLCGFATRWIQRLL